MLIEGIVIKSPSLGNLNKLSRTSQNFMKEVS